MTISQSINGDELTLCPEGRLDSVTSDAFASCIAENFTGILRSLVLDFSGVDYISSKGLRVLVSVYKQLDGRSMKIVSANASVQEVLRLSGLLKVFTVE